MSDGSVTIDTKLDDSGAKKGLGALSSTLGKVGSGLTTAFKAGATAITAASTAVGGLVATSVNAYAEYEQLVGGVDTLFKSSSEKLQKYADEAYKTAGLSANEYMSTVTSFSASLLQSLGGNTEKAADYANQALIDMSDNANKMGTSMESIQWAYQGFAKQNYTMLDNLKLGYGGTKEEMERLLADAQKLTGVKYDINSFADVTQAIHAIQTQLGITGTTAKEASTTIEGSINSVKGAFNNLLVGITNPDADWDKLIQNLVDTVKVAGENILPAVKSALVGVSSLIRDLFPMIAQQIPSLISEILPGLFEAGTKIIDSLIQGAITYLPQLIPVAMQVIQQIITGIITYLPQLVPIALQIIQSIVNILLQNLPTLINVGIQVILQLILGIAQMLPQLIPQALEAIMTIVNGLIENLPLLIETGIELIVGLVEGLVNAIPKIIEATPKIITSLVKALTDPNMLGKIVEGAIRLMVALTLGLIQAIPQIIAAVPQIINSIRDTFSNYDWGALGRSLLEGIMKGFSNVGNLITQTVSNVGNSIVGGFKNFFGIHSPSRVMAKWGKYLPQGLALGIEKDSKQPIKSIDKMNKSILDNFDLNGLYTKMQSAVNLETGKIATNLSTTAISNKMLTANITLKQGDVYMDTTKVGRAVTPAITKTLRGAGAY